MDNISGVQRLEGAQGLVDEILGVIIRQVLCSDHTVHIGLHELLNHCRAFMSRARRNKVKWEG